MIAIDMEMPKGCWYSTNLKLSGIATCPLKTYCSKKHIKEAPLDTRPSDCPLVEIVTCKECKCECTWKNGEKFSETRPYFFCEDGERRESKCVQY